MGGGKGAARKILRRGREVTKHGAGQVLYQVNSASYPRQELELQGCKKRVATYTVSHQASTHPPTLPSAGTVATIMAARNFTADYIRSLLFRKQGWKIRPKT